MFRFDLLDEYSTVIQPHFQPKQKRTLKRRLQGSHVFFKLTLALLGTIIVVVSLA